MLLLSLLPLAAETEQDHSHDAYQDRREYTRTRVEKIERMLIGTLSQGVEILVHLTVLDGVRAGERHDSV